MQGMPIGEVIGSRKVPSNQTGNVEIIADDITVDYLLPDSSDVLTFELDSLEIARDDARVLIDAAIDLVIKSELDALVVQDPRHMGYLSVKTMVAHLAGEAVEPVVDTGVVLVTRENMDEPEIRKLIE